MSLAIQKGTDLAFANYVALASVLMEDLLELMGRESDSPSWRREFVRSSAAVIEGYAHCLRDIVRATILATGPEISGSELDAVFCERSVEVCERVKLSMLAAFKRLDLQPLPDFGSKEWQGAQLLLRRRHKLMHPKAPSDYEIPDADWRQMRDGAYWVISQAGRFAREVHRKYG